MYNNINMILVLIAIIINSIIFGYVGRNTNKTNKSYLMFLLFIILYTIFDCIIIQAFNSIEAKNIIIKIQALFWMPLAILFLNFTYIFLRKQKDEIYYLFIISTITAVFFTLFTDKVLIGFKGFNFGTMAYTGPWFLPVTFIGIIPSAIYALYLIQKEGKIINLFNKNKLIQRDEGVLSVQLKILFYGSVACLIIAISTNIFFDEVLGYSGEIHLASLTLSIQSVFLLPALLKYNFLNKPMEKLGDELYANSSDAVLITNHKGLILNLNNSARKLFKLKNKVINIKIEDLFKSDYNYFINNYNYETKTISGKHVSITQSNIEKSNKSLGKILVIRDISQRKKAEEELILAHHVAGLGSFTYDINKDLVTWSDQLYKIYGKDKKTFIPTKETFFNEIVHADSKQKVIKKVEEAVKNKLTDFDYIHKTLMLNGNSKWFQAIINIKYNKNNEAITMNGTSQDITELFLTRLDLEKSELRLQKAQEIAKLGFWEENHNTGEIFWSVILKNMFGIKKEAIIKKDKFWKRLHPEDVDWMKENWEKAEKEKTPYSGTFRIISQDGKTKHLMEQAEFIKDSNNNLFKTIGTVIDMTELHQYQEELRELSSHIQNAQEKERAHIAREIHDELGQRLTGITMDLSFLNSKILEYTPDQIKESLSALAVQAEETIQIIRKISQELRPSILDDLGLISAIDWLKEQYNKRTDIHFTMDMPPDDININSEYATAVFRITQEALTNIIRHAKAKNVDIQMQINNSQIKLKVKDDGLGIKEQSKITNNKTFGVFGMKERASILGGQLEINKNPNNGTTVKLILPYKEKSRTNI